MSESQRSQGLVFGEVAELYHRSRPGYPERVFDEIEAYAGLGTGSAVLEVGAGTGKATVSMARRGWRVTGLEPSPAMAEVARRNLEEFPGCEVVETSFEHWAAEGHQFSAVCAAQAWHWVDPAVAFAKAASVLAPGGSLALVWNRPDGGDEKLRRQLDEAYQRLAPELAAAAPGERPGERTAEIDGSGLFGSVRLVKVPWETVYLARDYGDLMRTQSDHRLLPPQRLDPLLAEVEEVITVAGGEYRVGYETLLYLSRRHGSDNGRHG